MGRFLRPQALVNCASGDCPQVATLLEVYHCRDSEHMTLDRCQSDGRASWTEKDRNGRTLGQRSLLSAQVDAQISKASASPASSARGASFFDPTAGPNGAFRRAFQAQLA